MSDVVVRVIGDISDIEAKAAIVQHLTDEATSKWAEAHRTIIRGMSEVGRGISYMMQGVRMAVRIAGRTLNPFENAMLTMISSSASVMMTVATALSTGSLGILAGLGVAIALVAAEISILESAKVMADFVALQSKFTDIEQTLANAPTISLGGLGLGGL